MHPTGTSESLIIQDVDKTAGDNISRIVNGKETLDAIRSAPENVRNQLVGEVVLFATLFPNTKETPPIHSRT